MGVSTQTALRLILRASLIRGSESTPHPMPARRIPFRAWGVPPTWKWVMLISDLFHKGDYIHLNWE